MFSETIKDLAKPQWLAALGVLKTSDGMAIRELADRLDVSYMAAKQYGEDLTRMGYLQRIRTPRTAVGRPEIAYRVAAKADAIFPDVGMSFSLELLENSRQLFGENAPDRLLYQHFESLHAHWSPLLEPLTHPFEKAGKLATLRRAYGAVSSFIPATDTPARLIEHHHPLNRVFALHPRAVGMDTRLIGDLLGTRVERREKENIPSCIEYLLPDVSADHPD